MSLKYPEKVFARMIRISDNEERFLLRQDTTIQFGHSSKPLGIAIMTNPGSFSFKDSKEWESFQNGDTPYQVFEAYDKPDLTMQNLIKVIRDAYQKLNIGMPNGVVQIFNISNIVESKKENVEEMHNKAFHVIQNNDSVDAKRLIEPVANDEYEFIKTSGKVDFIIMGFADNVFSTQVLKLKAWAENPRVSSKIVCAMDSKGRFSHPRRWRTEISLMDKAIEGLGKVLELDKETRKNYKTGYTILRWNGIYGKEAKFIVRDNCNNHQSIFIPGRVQDLVWTSVDLTNVPELNDWSSFGNEIVEDLELIAF